MDPVAAFGLAVNVLAVVDFSKTFLEILGQVREVGSSTASREIGAVVRSLQLSNAKVKTQSQAFRDLVDECQKISEELLTTVEDVRVPESSTLATRIKVTARTIWNHGKIEQKKSRLAVIREQLLFDMIVPMAFKVDVIPDGKALDRQTQTLLDAIQTGQDTHQAALEHVRRLYEDHVTNQHLQHAETVSLLHDISLRLPKNLQSHPLEMSEENALHRQNVLERIRRCLCFDQQYDRQYDIENTHQATFEWIYNQFPTGATKATWSDFQSWLVNNHGIHWISGKAGSGKSTLMKFLSSGQQMLASLSQWAAGGHLVVLSFYFWNPGTRLQKSLEGLFRSILLQALEKCPELAEETFPDRFECSSDWGHFPTMNQLKRAFAALTTPGLTDAAGVPLKLALIIDGLDEFEAGATTLTDLAEIFTSAAPSPSFKALLSSRPENAFEDAFRHSPKLRLHHLTQDDVVKYVNDKIHNHPRMLQLASQNPKESENLVSEIVQAAQGVFLWVKLVVRSLSEGLQNHDDISILTERLRELPTGLEELFRYMLLRIPGIYKRSMSQTFQLLRSSTELRAKVVPEPRELGIPMHRLTALGLHFALLDSETVLQSGIRQFTEETAYSEILSVEARVKSHCAGLVELNAVVEDMRGEFDGRHGTEVKATRHTTSSMVDEGHHWIDPKLQFIHRSVTEYLWKEDVWNGVLGETEGTDFDPWRALVQSLVMQAKKCSLESQSIAKSERIDVARYGKIDLISLKQRAWMFVMTALEIEHELEEMNDMAQLEMLDTLEESLTTRCEPVWWNSYRSYLTMEKYESISWDDNFFAIVICYGLWRYVQARRQAHGPTSIRKSGRPLLSYACGPEHLYGTEEHAIDVRTVEALLLHGANTNEKFDGYSPWETALYAWRLRSPNTKWHSVSDGRPPEVNRKLLPILKVLLTHGANPNAYTEEDYSIAKYVRQKRRYSVLLLMERSLYGGCEPDVEQVYDWTMAGKEVIKDIIKSLKEKVAEAKEWRMVEGVFVQHGGADTSVSLSGELVVAAAAAGGEVVIDRSTSLKRQYRCTVF